MDAIITILFIILIIKFAFRILPDLIGFMFSLIFGLVAVALILAFLPFLGALFFCGDVVILLLLLMLIRRIK